MRQCRICRQLDVTNSMRNCFDNDGLVAKELFLLFNVVIVELKDAPALICRKCQKHVMQAAELRNLCWSSAEYFKEHLLQEHFLWNENLRELKLASNIETAGAVIEAGKPGDKTEVINEASNSTGAKPNEIEVKDETVEKLTESTATVKAIFDQLPVTNGCELEQSDLDFIREADELLMQSLVQIERIEESLLNTQIENAAADSIKVELISSQADNVENIELIFPEADKDSSNNNVQDVQKAPLQEKTDEAQIITDESKQKETELDLSKLLNLTKEQITDMTSEIERILPPDKTPISSKRKIKERRMTLPTYPNLIRIDLRRSRIINKRVNEEAPLVSEAKTAQIISNKRFRRLTIDVPKEKPNKVGRKPTCELCRRRFDNKEQLIKHLQGDHNPFGDTISKWN